MRSNSFVVERQADLREVVETLLEDGEPALECLHIDESLSAR